jgi:molecular chaperone GrpE
MSPSEERAADDKSEAGIHGQEAGVPGVDEAGPNGAGEATPTGAHGDLARERDEYLRNWQRAQADYQNLRRRVQSDIDAAIHRSKKGFYSELLLVLDYLDMACASPCQNADAKGLLAGVEMTRGVLLQALEREGVKPIAANGAFDPALHDAVESVETQDKPAGTILAVLRRGWTSTQGVLRPAQVKVAGAPAARDAAAANAASGTGAAAGDGGS